MMLVSMVQRSMEKQQDTLCTRVKLLRVALQKTEYQMCPSWKPVEVLVKNRWLWTDQEGEAERLLREGNKSAGGWSLRNNPERGTPLTLALWKAETDGAL